MKKFLAATITASLFAIAAPAAHAASLAPSNFNVTASLAAACTITTVGTPVVAFATYTAFQATALTATPATIGIQCSRGLSAPTFAFDGGTGGGVIAGLNYTVSATAGAATAGTPATAAAIGTPDTRTITLAGNMPAGQAGDCAGNAASCVATVTAVRTITISY
ncbi:MAG: hypothetical protein HOO95_08055 [Gallionella sp.]|nr:hypothetical protein [Gallionella sp.]